MESVAAAMTIHANNTIYTSNSMSEPSHLASGNAISHSIEIDSQPMHPINPATRILNQEQSILETHLQHMLHLPTANFKSSHQMHMIDVSLGKQAQFIAVLPTGGGKSLSFELPAAVENQSITIVFCPFTALIEDMMERAVQHNTAAFKWTTSILPPSNIKLLFVAFESIASPQLHQ